MARNGFRPRTVLREHGFFEAFADPSIRQDLSVLDSWGRSWHFDQVAFKPSLVVPWRGHLLIVR